MIYSTEVSVDQAEIGPAAAKSSPAAEQEDRVAPVAKGKAAIQRTPKTSQNPQSQLPGAELLKGRKVLAFNEITILKKLQLISLCPLWFLEILHAELEVIGLVLRRVA